MFLGVGFNSALIPCKQLQAGVWSSHVNCVTREWILLPIQAHLSIPILPHSTQMIVSHFTAHYALPTFHHSLLPAPCSLLPALCFPAHDSRFTTPSSLLTTHYSLLTTHYSLFTTHYSLLTIQYSLLATHYTLLTTHYSLLTTHYSLLTAHRSLPTTQRSLLTTHHSLLTAHHSLLTTYYSLLQPNNHYGLHKLPVGEGRQRRAAADLNFRDIAKGVHLATSCARPGHVPSCPSFRWHRHQYYRRRHRHRRRHHHRRCCHHLQPPTPLPSPSTLVQTLPTAPDSSQPSTPSSPAHHTIEPYSAFVMPIQDHTCTGPPHHAAPPTHCAARSHSQGSTPHELLHTSYYSLVTTHY